MKLCLMIGPTGIGKTNRSITMARQHGAPVISLDRFQIFQELATGTCRPTPKELEGTERIFLAERRVASGELSSGESYQILLGLIEKLSHQHRMVILEGGSISLCSVLFEQGFIRRFHIDVEFLTIQDMPGYRSRVMARLQEMLTGSTEQRSMLEELARLWHDPSQVSFVETIVGYDVLVQHCRRTQTTPHDLMQKPMEAALFDEVLDAHLAYAQWQSAVFDKFRRIYE